jgi:MGT family glycosyltransferase
MEAAAGPFRYSEEQVANVFMLGELVMRGTRALAPALTRLLAAERPACVVHDAVAVWGRVAAARAGIPAVSSISTFLITLPVALSTPRLAAQQPGVFWRGIIPFLRFVRTCAAFRREGGRADLPWRRALSLDLFINEEPVNLVYTSRTLQPRGATFGPQFRFVGPTLRDEPEDPAFPHEALEQGPVLYVAMGTIFHARDAFYRDCVAAFRDWPGTVVLSVGSEESAHALREAPPHFVVRARVPQLAVLRRTAVFVTHAGMNSASEALWHGVPMVTVPQGADQFLVAGRLATLGAGVDLRRAPAPPRLRAAADRVLGDPAYAKRAAALGNTLKEAGGASRAADAVLARAGNIHDRPVE